MRWADHSSRGVLLIVGVSEYDCEFSTMRRPCPTGAAAERLKKKREFIYVIDEHGCPNLKLVAM